jgi:P pilus assembly chaperone PapD
VEVLGIDPGQVKEIRVLDMNGKEVQKTEGSRRFAVSGIPAATYIVRVVTLENKAHYLKLVKQ